jgi:hypothetical protein
LFGNCTAASSVAPLNSFGSRPVISVMTIRNDAALFSLCPPASSTLKNGVSIFATMS